MLAFLLVVQIIITALLVGVILMQRSEGGGLGMGGSPTGLMSARGAADFLTRATTILASVFVLLAIASAVVASRLSGPGAIDTSLQRIAPKPEAPVPAPSVPMNGDPGAAAAGQGSNIVTPIAGSTPAAAPVPATKAPTVTERSTPRAVAVPAPAPRSTPRDAAPAAPPAVVPTTLPSIAPKPVPTPGPVGPAGNSN